jgi:hypothetical protein
MSDESQEMLKVTVRYGGERVTVLIPKASATRDDALSAAGVELDVQVTEENGDKLEPGSPLTEKNGELQAVPKSRDGGK